MVGAEGVEPTTLRRFKSIVFPLQSTAYELFRLANIWRTLFVSTCNSSQMCLYYGGKRAEKQAGSLNIFYH
jgi:hypothetical protein